MPKAGFHRRRVLGRRLPIVPRWRVDRTETIVSRVRPHGSTDPAFVPKRRAPDQRIDRRPEWAVAVVVGVFTLLGAATAALLANHGTSSVQQAQITATRQTQRTTAKGAARVLVLELSTALTYTATLQSSGHWFRIGAERVPVDVPPSDLRRVAALVSGNEWGQLLTAIADSQTVSNQMRQRTIGRPVGPREFLALARDEDMIQAGIHALNDLAEAPP